MKQTRLIMDMPITVEIVDSSVAPAIFDQVFAYFHWVDDTFSPFKETSLVSQINLGMLKPANYSAELKSILKLAEATKIETDGYFDVWYQGKFDPSGLVKGWAIGAALRLVHQAGFQNAYVEAGGDLQTLGLNINGQPWRVGIRHPFSPRHIVKTISLHNEGMATSGTYERGQHIYNPHQPGRPLTDIVSVTVIGPQIVDADRFATAAFAMGRQGIEFIESLTGFEGYQIDARGMATFTRGFPRYVE